MRLSRSYGLNIDKVFLDIFAQAQAHADDKTLSELGLRGREQEWGFVWMTDYFLDRFDFQRALQYAEKALTIAPDSSICKSNLEKIKTVHERNSHQLAYGTLESNYVNRFWESSFNFAMTVAYMVEKTDMPFDFLVNYCLEYARTLKPESVDVRLLSSWHSYRSGKIGDAIEETISALKIDGSCAQLWVNMGIYQLAAKNYVYAQRSFATALNLYPGYPNRNQMLAMMMEAQKMGAVQGDDKVLN